MTWRSVLTTMMMTAALVATTAIGGTTAGAQPDNTQPDTTQPDTTQPDTTQPSSRQLRECAPPSTPSDGFETADPTEVGMDAAALRAAVLLATTRLRTNVQVFRNNCLVGSGPFNSVTGNVPWHLWSATKSVLSMVTGIAVTRGLIDVDAPIGTYLPPGEGDDAHRAITVRNLLQQNSGLTQGIVSEGITAGLDLAVDAPGQALAVPFVSPPGTNFQYSQLGPDLLAYVVSRAVGEDLEAFAQRELFSPIGIEPGDYHWSRDRSGHNYGFALLFMPPNDFARLGMVMANDGEWNGRRIIGSDYIAQLRQSSDTNACYGYLFWLNRTPCVGPSFPSEQVVDVPLMAGMPTDAYAMVGFLQQNTFIVPSLGLQVTWTGTLGDISPDLSTLLSASTNSELINSFFGALIRALPNEGLAPVPYVPTFNGNLDVGSFFDPALALGTVGIGPYASRGTGFPIRLPLADTPPGCLLIACLPISPDTPGRTGN